MKYEKPPLSISEQIELLLERGLNISDTNFVAMFLSRVSYYRFSAYLRPFQILGGFHIFKENATFEKAYQIYIFDRELRYIVFKAIAKIEIALRARLINIYSPIFGSFWYTDNELFHDKIHHENCIIRIKSEVHKSKETFIKHYRSKYNEPELPPAWMALEVVSFGTLSRLYKNLSNNAYKNEIAKSFHLSTSLLESWLESLTFVRNICAHHSRLWNRKKIVSPAIPKRVSDPWIVIPSIDNEHIYNILVIICYLIRTLGNDKHFVNELLQLIEMNPDISLSPMGFPKEWKSDPFWDLNINK